MVKALSCNLLQMSMSSGRSRTSLGCPLVSRSHGCAASLRYLLISPRRLTESCGRRDRQRTLLRTRILTVAMARGGTERVTGRTCLLFERCIAGGGGFIHLPKAKGLILARKETWGETRFAHQDLPILSAGLTPQLSLSAFSMYLNASASMPFIPYSAARVSTQSKRLA